VNGQIALRRSANCYGWQTARHRWWPGCLGFGIARDLL